MRKKKIPGNTHRKGFSDVSIFIQRKGLDALPTG
jgi:hypothetical protein